MLCNLENTMQRSFDLYCTLLEEVKPYFNSNTADIIQLMQEDVFRLYPETKSTVTVKKRSVRENITYLINLSYYLAEYVTFFSAHYSILNDISHEAPCY